jgi:hypothetical protein
VTTDAARYEDDQPLPGGPAGTRDSGIGPAGWARGLGPAPKGVIIDGAEYALDGQAETPHGGSWGFIPWEWRGYR